MKHYLFRHGKGYLHITEAGKVTHTNSLEYATPFPDMASAKNIRDDNLSFGPIDIVRV